MQVSGLVTVHCNMFGSQCCTASDIYDRRTIQCSNRKRCCIIGTGAYAKIVGVAGTEDSVLNGSAGQINC